MESSVLYRDCRGNSICMVEALRTGIEQGYEPSKEELMMVSGFLGQPTKKVGAFEGRYLDVFSRLVQKNCVLVGDGELCIYSWNPRAYVRYFPVSIDATGTILYIDSKGRVSTIAYPIHRSHDIEGRGVRIVDPIEKAIVEVTGRVDGYPITFYYNPFLKRWIPATRYLLHNMVYMGRQLIIEDHGEIVNPYVRIADELASNTGLYSLLKKYSGYTFTFILEPPEPAITRPNIELFNLEDFRLYLLCVRLDDGTLLTVKESRELLEWSSIPVIETSIENMESLKDFIDKARNDLYRRSYFIRYSNDKYRPYTLEVKSKLYPEAMAVKYQSSPKSLFILASYGYGDKAVELLTEYGDIRSVGRELVSMYNRLEKILSNRIGESVVDNMLKETNLYRQLKGELERARRTQNTSRFIRKLLALSSGETLYEARENLKKILNILEGEK